MTESREKWSECSSRLRDLHFVVSQRCAQQHWMWLRVFSSVLCEKLLETEGVPAETLELDSSSKWLGHGDSEMSFDFSEP